MKKSQKQWVKEQLHQYGEVTRNQALQNHITRLSAIILNLKNEGYDLHPFARGGDYVYAIEKPAQKKPQLVYDPINNVMKMV